MVICLAIRILACSEKKNIASTGNCEMKKRNIALLSFLSMALLTVCGNILTGQESSPGSEETVVESVEITDTPMEGVLLTGNQSVVIEAYDWGPVVAKTIITMIRL